MLTMCTFHGMILFSFQIKSTENPTFSSSQNDEAAVVPQKPRYNPLQLGNTRYIEELINSTSNTVSNDVPAHSEQQSVMELLRHQNSTTTNSMNNADNVMELLMTSQYILAQAAHNLVTQETETQV